MGGRGIDYSKWNDIEVSDDEDDTRKNIDKASFFRWRHQARLERMAQRKEMKEELRRKRALPSPTPADAADIARLEAALAKAPPLNVDTLCRDGFSSTRINPARADAPPPDLPPPSAPLPPPATPPFPPPEEAVGAKEKEPKPTVPEETTEGEGAGLGETEVAQFFVAQEKALATLGQQEDWRQAREVFLAQRDLCTPLGQHAATLAAIDCRLSVQPQRARRLARAALLISYIVDAAKEMQRDPREAQVVETVLEGLEREERAKPGSLDADTTQFEESFVAKATQRILEIRSQAADAAPPDPRQVLKSLPTAMREAFERRDREALNAAARTIPPPIFSYHLHRCTKAGLWIERDPSAPAAPSSPPPAPPTSSASAQTDPPTPHSPPPPSSSSWP